MLRFFDRLATVPEQAIEVPKIFIEDVPMRAVLRATLVLRRAFSCGCRTGYRSAQVHYRGHPSVRESQLAEQLVEVPTILYFPEQKVDIPVPGRGGRIAGLQGFLPRQSPTAPILSLERIF